MIPGVLTRLLQVDPPENDPVDRLAFVAAREICRRHARSFYFASHFLPAAKRYAAYAVYAFCRLLDDAVDEVEINQQNGNLAPPKLSGITTRAIPPAEIFEPSAPCRHPERSERTSHRQEPSGAGLSLGTAGNTVLSDERSVRCAQDDGTAQTFQGALQDQSQICVEAAIASFTTTLDRIYSAGLSLPDPAKRTESQHAMRAFELTVRRYGMQQQYFLDLAEGCRMDLTVSRYATWADLELYCYRVAGVVGLMMCPIFGLTRRDAERQAVQMGHAMQLTNILRDVREDWERGRVYLPQEDLDRFGYAEADIEKGVADERFCQLMQFQIARARRLYEEGSAGLSALANDGSRLTASAMAVIYSGILEAIERQGYDVYSSRAHMTAGQKIARVPKAWKLAAAEEGEPVPRVF